VAALIDTHQVSGPGRQLTALAGALRSRGVAMRVVMLHRGGRPPAPFAGYLADHGVDHVVLDEQGPTDLRPIGALRDALAAYAPDVVQTHSYKTNFLYRLARRGLPRRPWVAFFHGTTAENRRVRAYHWLDRRVMAGADHIVVMSARHREQLGDRSSVRVVHNAVIPLPDGQPLPDLTPFRGLGRDGRPRALVAVVGRLSHEKGVDVFLHAMATLRGRGHDVHAVLAGDGPARAELETLRGTLGLTDAVHFLGGVSAVNALYRSVDAVVLPSRSEGLPNVLLEALHHDRPVVATRVGAVGEVLTDDRAGRVVPPGDPEALAEAMAHVLAHGSGDEARRARADTAARFSLDRRVEAHLALYAELLRGAPAGGWPR
jgi:glycosyltransferase involved in cell wall biosynthesis